MLNSEKIYFISYMIIFDKQKSFWVKIDQLFFKLNSLSSEATLHLGYILNVRLSLRHIIRASKI